MLSIINHCNMPNVVLPNLGRVRAENYPVKLLEFSCRPQREQGGPLISCCGDNLQGPRHFLHSATISIIGQRGEAAIDVPDHIGIGCEHALSIRLEPGIEGPPVWMVLSILNLRAQATIWRAVAPSFTLPRPTSPSIFSTIPCSITGARRGL